MVRVPLPLFLRRFRLLLTLSEGLRNFPPVFVPEWTVVQPVPFCAFSQVARFPLTIQYRVVSRASILLPRRASWLHCDAFQSNFPSLSFARELALVPAMLLLSTLHTHASLPTSSNFLIEPLYQHLSDIFWTHTSHVNWYHYRRPVEHPCVPVRPFYA